MHNLRIGTGQMIEELFPSLDNFFFGGGVRPHERYINSLDYID